MISRAYAPLHYLYALAKYVNTHIILPCKGKFTQFNYVYEQTLHSTCLLYTDQIELEYGNVYVLFVFSCFSLRNRSAYRREANKMKFPGFSINTAAYKMYTAAYMCLFVCVFSVWYNTHSIIIKRTAVFAIWKQLNVKRPCLEIKAQIK